MSDIDHPEAGRKIPAELAELMRKVLRRMVATYGRRFMAQYQGADADDVRVVWARELSGYVNRQQAVAWAFENLPEEPPNAISFRNLCRRFPAQPQKPALEPPASPQRIADAMAGARVALQAQPATSTAWAERILARHEAGERISPGVLKNARSVHRTSTVDDPVKT